jgi:hypothetical protein
MHAQVRVTPLSVFTCPSDLKSDPTFDLDAESGGYLTTLARCNYVAVFGTLELEDCEGMGPGEQCAGDGAFFHNSRLTFAGIPDGLSNTLFVGERSSRLGFSTWVGVATGGEEAFARILGIADHPPNHPTGHFDDFGSQHTSGTQFLLGDGSVHWITQNIDLNVYYALSTRSGGEAVTLP